MLKIIDHLLESYGQKLASLVSYSDVMDSLRVQTEGIMSKYFERSRLIIAENMGCSLAIKACLDLHIKLLYKFQLKPS